MDDVVGNVVTKAVNDAPNVSNNISDMVDNLTYSLFGFHAGKLLTSYLVICGICSIISTSLPSPIDIVDKQNIKLSLRIRSSQFYNVFYNIIKFLALNVKYAASFVSPKYMPLINKLTNLRDTLTNISNKEQLEDNHGINIEEIIANLQVTSFDKNGNPIIFDAKSNKSFVLTTKSGKSISEDNKDDVILKEVKMTKN